MDLSFRGTRGGSLYATRLGSSATSVALLLDAASLPERINKSSRVIIKPNLVEALQPPITTPVGLVSSIVEYIQSNSPGVEVIIADGTGSLDYDTAHVFRELGYAEAASRLRVRLIDLNNEELVSLQIPGLKRWPEFYLPKLVMESFLLSVPVLKAHTLAGVTLTMKNMVGLAPPSHYQQGGHWRKSSFHTDIDEAVYELNRYRTPDFTVLDATVGMREAHLWGAHLDPPPGLIVAGSDPVKIDAFGASLLNRDWREVGHIRLANGVIGEAEPNMPEFVEGEETESGAGVKPSEELTRD
ncbi:MAG: DUF362 domain-containing protein [Thermodesulfobacteriota bacterium]